MNFKVYYADHFQVHLDSHHRFPMNKYELIRSSLLKQNIVTFDQLVPAQMCSWADLQLAHDPNYLNELKNLTLDKRKVRRIGFPLEESMINRARASVNAFYQASISALKLGFSSSLAGGTHHAHYDYGSGYCFFNDFAVSCRKLWTKKPEMKILILDLDVHQGDGNASMLKDDPRVMVVSLHGKSNFPFKKYPSDIDVEFESNATDDVYLAKLEQTLEALSTRSFDLLMYQAGVDPLSDDTLGTLSLTFDGLMQRDQKVFQWAQSKKIPVAMALGGGYAKPIDKTVLAVLNTYRIVKNIYTLRG